MSGDRTYSLSCTEGKVRVDFEAHASPSHSSATAICARLRDMTGGYGVVLAQLHIELMYATLDTTTKGYVERVCIQYDTLCLAMQRTCVAP